MLDTATLDAATIDDAAVRRWAALAVQVLTTHRDEIDGLNVFPVADRDTGTNLLATMTAACGALTDDVDPTAALAAGARAGARGNSGVLLAEVLAGLAEPGVPIDGPGLVRGLRAAARRASAAVAEPVPGTVLTVLDAVADAVGASPGGAPAVLGVATAAARVAVAATTSQLSQLARAGVVDAGARGLELVLVALRCALTAEALPVPAAVPPPPRPPAPAPGFEVVHRLDGTDRARVERLRLRLVELGTSVVVGGDPDGTTTVHVHAADAGAVLEAGLAAGRVHGIEIQVLDPRTDDPLAVDRGVLAVVGAPALAELFGGGGAAVHVVEPGAHAGTLLAAALLGPGPQDRVLLGNGVLEATVLAEAVAAARAGGRRVTVVPSASAVQGLAALAVHDPTRDAGDDVVAMAEAAGACRRGGLEVATGEGLTWVGRCAPGDVLALLDGDVAIIETDQLTAAERLLDRMLGAGGELVTVLTGADAEDGLPAALAAHVAGEHRGVELVVLPVGLAGTVLELGVE